MFDIVSPERIHDLIQVYGLWVLFALVMAESMGVPLPGETALVTAALYAGSTHMISLQAVVTTASIAAIIGDNIGYLLGRSIGLRLILRYGDRFHIGSNRLKIGQYFFMRHGGKIVFFGRFVALLRTFAALLAGANRMRWWYFLLMNACGGVCWAIVFGGTAYLFGQQVEHVKGPIGLLLFVVAIGFVFAGMVFFRHHEKELEKRAKAALGDQ
ncbi:DedA family protein [Rhizobium calliandrae]|uniref:DedA family protein n=1 Tax=Rhizobium calliandrae TaxID=1312182 RepID=A0ABT7KMM6_9HYPH|nr:DedA family protein [Rhizobium calliandrae]MDL2409188.1 DedA family protein [Rhizobium calliandrae]